MRTLFPLLHASLLPVISLFLVGCSSDDDEAPPPQGPPPVTFVHPTGDDLIEWAPFTGRLEAVEAVEVRSRVSGFLESIEFKDGDLVEAGQLLFVIDDRPFQAELDAALADLESAKASRDLAQANLSRGKSLLESNAIAREDVDIRQGTLAESEAEVQAAAARAELAKLNVEFTQITAPIAGRISDRSVSVGNLVSGGSTQSTLLTSIVSIDPIYCQIEADDRFILNYKRTSTGTSNGPSSTEIQIGLEDEEGYPRTGTLDFIDNQFDTETATLRLRAAVPNEDGFLLPGMFVRVRLPGAGEKHVMLVPDLAVQTNQTQNTVLVIGENNIVESRPVTLGSLQPSNMRVIREGLSLEDRVIVSGFFMARPGAPVTPSPAQPTPEEPAASAE